MGDRSQIAIKQPTKTDPDAKVYLYSHWGGSDVYLQLQAALKPRQRWDDSEYLTRIIAREMGMGEGGETGFGIGNAPHGDVEHAIPVLDMEKQQISFEDAEWDHNKNPAARTLVLSFDEFADEADIVGRIEGKEEA